MIEEPENMHPDIDTPWGPISYDQAKVAQAVADAREFAEYADKDGFDPNDALDLIREIAALPPPPRLVRGAIQQGETMCE